MMPSEKLKLKALMGPAHEGSSGPGRYHHQWCFCFQRRPSPWRGAHRRKGGMEGEIRLESQTSGHDSFGSFLVLTLQTWIKGEPP